VIAGSGLQDALAAHGLLAARGWPHQDTPDALRPLADHDAGPGTFLVVVDGQVLGECGWFGPPDGSGEVEVGYGLAPSARQRGIGTVAVRTLLEWVESQPGVRRVSASALVGNEASRRLLERLGFVADASAPPYVRYVREVPAWTTATDSG
jgi:RimJ/RimL family protein N-acetyltransferase